MRKIICFVGPCRSEWRLPYLVFSLLAICTAFSVGALAQIAIPLSDIFQEIKGGVTEIKSLDNRLFIGTDEGLWSVEKDEKPIKQENIDGGVIALRQFSGQIFVITPAGLWQATENGALIKVDGVNDIVNDGALDDRLFVGTNKGLWIVGKNSKSTYKEVRGRINHTGLFGKKIFINTDYGSWIIDSLDQADQIGPVSEIQGKVLAVQGFGNQVFVNSDNGSWVIDEAGNLTAIDVIIENVNAFIPFGEQLFVNTFKDSWIIDRSGKLNRVEEINERVSDSAILGNDLFINVGENLWKVGEDGNLTIIDEIKGPVDYIGTVDDRLFVTVENSSNKNLWIIDKTDGKIRISEIKDRINGVWPFAGKFFINTKSGSWIMNPDYSVAPVKDMAETVTDFSVFGDQLFVGTEKGLWIVSHDGTSSKRIESIKGRVKNISIVGQHGYVKISDTFFETSYRVDPKVRITTRPNPTDWWMDSFGFLVSSIWPNSLPAGRNPVEASYSDENGKNPYDQNIPKDFKFAVADGDTLVSENKFSTGDQFGYPVGLWTNEVHYWIKDNWGNAFDYRKEHFGFPGALLSAVLVALLIILAVLMCFAAAPVIGFCNSAIMRPWIRNFLSIGFIPIILYLPWARNHILRRYSFTLSRSNEFITLDAGFDYPDASLEPTNFIKNTKSKRGLLITGQSSDDMKTLFFRHLTAHYASRSKDLFSETTFPIYIFPDNYDANSFEIMIYQQLEHFGNISSDFAPLFLERGKLLIFFDRIDTITTEGGRRRFVRFVEKFGQKNLICCSVYRAEKEFDGFKRVDLPSFGPQTV